MIYTNNETGETVSAYKINDVVAGEGNYAITLRSAHKIIGLFPEQTISYTPRVGDYYIDNGEIINSEVMESAAFEASYSPPIIEAPIEEIVNSGE